jgi:hypothetical protein
MTVPQFEYAPMKISFRKKVRLEDLTPKPKNKNLVQEFFKVVVLGAGIAIAGITILILMGGLKLFGVKTLEP